MQQGLSGARAEYPAAAIRRGISGGTVQALYLYKIMKSQMMLISLIMQLKISAD
ncbi:hypothetical protein N172_13545 [Pantoea dispersa EGD-AAK13]|nr:hypothetical protein N172_13545 [Pantoea dispersa EGD-AAK13]